MSANICIGEYKKALEVYSRAHRRRRREHMTCTHTYRREERCHVTLSYVTIFSLSAFVMYVNKINKIFSVSCSHGMYETPYLIINQNMCTGSRRVEESFYHIKHDIWMQYYNTMIMTTPPQLYHKLHADKFTCSYASSYSSTLCCRISFVQMSPW